MAQEKPPPRKCRHNYPIETVPMAGGKRARCLGCGTRGPVRAETQGAVRALRAEARGSGS